VPPDDAPRRLAAAGGAAYVQSMRFPLPFLSRPPVVSVVRLSGTIAARSRALSDETVGPLLERAFRRGRTAAVALVVNSPGGSPVQSSMIGARLRRLSEDRRIPVTAYVEDVAASGGYWLASAADDIVVDESSIVGSIGVIYASFGFVRAIDRLGVERRVHTAGRSKSFLDPFRPETDQDLERLRALQDPIHRAFIDHVKARRGAKLPDGRDLFTGDIWVGRQAIEVGLADRIGHLVPDMKARFGDKVRFATFGPRRPLLSRFGIRLAEDLAQTAEDRLAFARFGL
jgi:signal peptide peptidase SppA